MLKLLTVWITTNLKILQEMGIPDHFTSLYSNSQNQTWSKELVQNWERSTSRLYIVTLLILLLCRVHHVKRQAEWITSWNQDAGRNINNLRYENDTTLIAESEEEPKSFLMRMKEESEKAGLKLSIQETKIMASGPITSWQIDGETMETVRNFILGGFQNHCRWWLQPWK